MLITPEQAFEQHLRDIYIVANGVVSELLPNDETGVKHQRFLILTPNRHSLLIVYNIDRNPPLNLKVGDTVHIEGTYVWNKYGGIIHETHSDVNKNQPDGQITVSVVK